MLNRYHLIALLAIAITACDTGGLLTVEHHDGGGGCPASTGSGPATGTDTQVGKCSDAGDLCHPMPDNSPVACAANSCTKVDDGCGGDLFCDTICTTTSAVASCGLPDGSPGCALCVETPEDIAVCTNPKHPVPYHCEWGYPQPDMCEPKSNDGVVFVACCEGVP